MANTRTENVIKNSTASIAYKVVHTLIQFIIRTAFIHILGMANYMSESLILRHVLLKEIGFRNIESVSPEN